VDFFDFLVTIFLPILPMVAGIVLAPRLTLAIAGKRKTPFFYIRFLIVTVVYLAIDFFLYYFIFAVINPLYFLSFTWVNDSVNSWHSFFWGIPGVYCLFGYIGALGTVIGKTPKPPPHRIW
jgi:hypothetical protein